MNLRIFGGRWEERNSPESIGNAGEEFFFFFFLGEEF